MTLRGLYASGGRGFLHEMLEIAGGANVFADVQREAVQPSQETLLARAPDVIIEVRATGLLTAAGAESEERKAWAALGSIPAVRNGRISVLTAITWSFPDRASDRAPTRSRARCTRRPSEPRRR